MHHALTSLAWFMWFFMSSICYRTLTLDQLWNFFYLYNIYLFRKANGSPLTLYKYGKILANFNVAIANISFHTITITMKTEFYETQRDYYFKKLPTVRRRWIKAWNSLIFFKFANIRHIANNITIWEILKEDITNNTNSNLFNYNIYVVMLFYYFR